MGHTLHRTPTTRARCALRLAAPSQDWNVFKQLCAAPWARGTPVHPRSQTRDEESLVDQRLRGGEPAQIGAIEDRGLHWGRGTHRVARRWTAALGLRGAHV